MTTTVQRVLITGGAGYIGSVLTPLLLSSGFKVTVLDNFRYGQFPFGGICHHPAFDVVNGDARDPRVLVPLVKYHDIIIPLAALVGAPLCDRDVVGATSTNEGAIASLVRTLGSYQWIIIPISNSGYGVGREGEECTETSPLNPVSLYGRTKVEAERLAFSCGNAVSLRLATVFGMSPRMRLDLLVNDFVWRAVHDKAVVLFEADFKRNYIHVQDVALTFLFTICHFHNMRNQIYNVGLSAANLSKRELCAKIQEHVPGFVYLESPIGEDPDKRDYTVSNAKLEALGWQTAMTLTDGIKELIKGCAMMRNTVHGNV